MNVTPADNRWALTEVMRLLAAWDGGEEPHRAQLVETMTELANEEVPVQLARTLALAAILTTVASTFADIASEEMEVSRRDLLARLEQELERRYGL